MGLTEVLKYACTTRDSLRLNSPDWWQFCRLWVRVALAMATTGPATRARTGGSRAGRRDAPNALRGAKPSTPVYPPGLPPGVWDWRAFRG